MNIDHHADDTSAPWRATAAYLYTLDLDGPALAWEYLRRHSGYRADWLNGRRRAVTTRWGLRQRRKPCARCPAGASALGHGH